jgi:integrase
MELQMLSNVFRLAVRRAVLKANPLAGRACYSVASEIRHCREVAPTPDGLHQIEYWLRGRGEQETADLACFLGYSGLRIGEALMLDWECVDWGEGLLHVTREKKGVFPWVPLSADLVGLLRQMQTRARSHLLFPSPFDPNAPRERTAFGNRLRKACKALGIGHVTPHGLRSYYVSRCRESGLTDAEVSMLIGDKSGPALIAAVYGSLAPAHLLAQARRVKLTAKNADNAAAQRSIKLIHTLTENDAQTGRATTGNGVSQHAAA